MLVAAMAASCRLIIPPRLMPTRWKRSADLSIQPTLSRTELAVRTSVHVQCHACSRVPQHLVPSVGAEPRPSVVKHKQRVVGVGALKTTHNVRPCVQAASEPHHKTHPSAAAAVAVHLVADGPLGLGHPHHPTRHQQCLQASKHGYREQQKHLLSTRPSTATAAVANLPKLTKNSNYLMITKVGQKQ